MSSHEQIRLQNRCIARVLATIVVGTLFGLTAAWAESAGGKRAIDVETVNLYIGADLGPITSLSPQDPNYPAKLVAAVATVHAAIVASNFPARAAALAQEIVARGPDVVALQEVSLIRRQSPGDLVIGGTVPATQVELDYLQILLDALRRYSGHYSSATYALLTQTGHFDDAWSEAHPSDPGLTWGHDDQLADKNNAFTLRIDLVLFRGEEFEATSAAVADPQIRSLSPLWFSDHAALSATLRIH